MWTEYSDNIDRVTDLYWYLKIITLSALQNTENKYPSYSWLKILHKSASQFTCKAIHIIPKKVRKRLFKLYETL